MTSPDNIAELIAVAEAATPGPYAVFIVKRDEEYVLLPSMRSGEIAAYRGENCDADVTFAQTLVAVD